MNTIEKNRKTEVLLIAPPLPLVSSRFLLESMNLSPLGLGYIAAVLQNEGFRVNCLNLSFGIKELKALEHYITQTKPKIIGFSTMTETYQNGLLLARFVKKVNPDLITVFGGPHVTFLYEETLVNDCVDIVIRREGEYTMLELAKYFVRGEGSLNDIKGIVYKSNGKVIRTGARPMIQDLDALPYPVRDFLDFEDHMNTDLKRARQMVIASRGCPGRCKFCAASALSGGRYRMRSVDNIAGELIDLKQKGMLVVFFGDDTVVVDIPRLLKLCSLLKELGITWGAECRVDAMTKDLAKILKDSGCIALQFGIESGSQELLDQMRKDITLQQIEQAVKWATEAKITVACSMMIGMPEDTEKSIKQTIDFGIKLQETYKAAALVACFTPYPGTYYYNHANELGVSITTRNYNQFFVLNSIIDTQHLTRWQIRKLFFDSQSQLLKSTPLNYKNLMRRLLKYSLKLTPYDIEFDMPMKQATK
jgi:anaerobic magnesium-protoporphyrin IX monomethyl ester cyclase